MVTEWASCGVTQHSEDSAPNDERHMRRCIELARLALDAGDVPVGAVVVRDGGVIGEGYERTRARLDPAAHAEVEALRAACATLDTLDLSDATLYTTVEPCLLCSYAVRQTRIRRVVYGVKAGSLGGATGRYPLLTDASSFTGCEPPEVTAGVLAEECEQLLAERGSRA
jgi:tRNA(adenine34) deaminase